MTARRIPLKAIGAIVMGGVIGDDTNADEVLRTVRTLLALTHIVSHNDGGGFAAEISQVVWTSHELLGLLLDKPKEPADANA